MSQGKISSSKNCLFVALLIAVLLAPLGVSLHAQDLEWAKRAGGTYSDISYSIAVDGAGNSYVTGYFNGSATFGPGEANQTTLTSAGEYDIFVAKYDPAGALLWAKRAGGTTFDEGKSIAVDGSGNSYVTGFFQGSATFGLGEANETTLTGAGFGDIFVAKYGPDGALLWAKRAGGTDSESGDGIAVDGAGNSYVTGYFQGSATFGPGEANEITISSAGSRDLFVAKYDPDGALLWAKRAGGTDFDEGTSIAVDGAGNSYVTGSFQGSATFGPGEANETTLTSAGSLDIFVAKYGPDGAVLWAKRAGGTDYYYGLGIAVDGDGNSYVTGYFYGSATFGPGEANETTLTSAGSLDIFVAKYGPDGAVLWAKRAGGTDYYYGLGIAVDGDGNSYVTGYFYGSATFGPGEANETTLTSAGFDDIFVAKYAPDGTLLWAKRAGGTDYDYGFGIAVDGAGNSYVTGYFYDSVTFSPDEANETTLTSAGFADIFVAKYAPDGALLWAKRAGGTDYDYGLSIAVDGAGNSYVTGYFFGSATFGPGEANETTLTSSAGYNDIFVAKFQGAAPVKPFVLLANKVTLKRTKQNTPAGDIHSNGTLTVEKGDPSTYNSNLTAVGKITIQKDNTINGDVTSATAISNSGTINGTPSVGAVDTEDLPSLSYSAGGSNKTVPSGGSLSVAPGSYNIVTLNSGGTLKLTSGEYFMNELRYPGSEAVIEIDLSSGDPITINVVSKLQLGKEVEIRLLPNGESDSELVTFNTLQSTAVSFGKEAYLLGSFNAPNAKVTLVKNSQLHGSICANEILVERDCLFLHHNSPGSLPGPGNLPKSSSDEEEVISDQSPVTSYQLEQNYPNPFNPTTTINFALPEAGEVNLSIFNTNGQLVKQVANGKYASGRHQIVWDATDDRGERVASGVYVYLLKAGPSTGSGQAFTAQKKLVLMK